VVPAVEEGLGTGLQDGLPQQRERPRAEERRNQTIPETQLGTGPHCGVPAPSWEIERSVLPVKFSVPTCD